MDEVEITRTHPVPDTLQPVDLILEPLPRSVSTARHAVGQMLDDARLGSTELAEDVLLLVSEVVTNAVLHANTALRVRASIKAGRVLVAVGDDDPHHAPRPSHRGLSATSGRGMRLVDLLAASWGVEVLESSKVVWFEAAPVTGPLGA